MDRFCKYKKKCKYLNIYLIYTSCAYFLALLFLLTGLSLCGEEILRECCVCRCTAVISLHKHISSLLNLMYMHISTLTKLDCLSRQKASLPSMMYKQSV